MKRSTFLVAATLLLGTTAAVPAFADANHHRGGDGQGGRAESTDNMGVPGMMDRGMGQMMRMMQMMHGGMRGTNVPMDGMMGAGGGMMGMGGGMMGAGGGMMGHSNHMQRLFDTDDDGTVSPAELRDGLQEALKTYDADNDGRLSLTEFETLHTAHIREYTVDRFQFFDADGDGQITNEELTVPADRMERMMKRTETRSGNGSDMMNGDQPRNMMKDN